MLNEFFGFFSVFQFSSILGLMVISISHHDHGTGRTWASSAPIPMMLIGYAAAVRQGPRKSGTVTEADHFGPLFCCLSSVWRLMMYNKERKRGYDP